MLVTVWVKIFFHALHWMKENLLEGFCTYYADFWAIIRIKVKEKGRCYPLICLFSTSKHKNLFPSHRIGMLDIISTSKEHFFSRFSIDPSTYSFFISKQRKLSSIHYIEITSHFLFWELVSRWYIAFTDSISNTRKNFDWIHLWFFSKIKIENNAFWECQVKRKLLVHLSKP